MGRNMDDAGNPAEFPAREQAFIDDSLRDSGVDPARILEDIRSHQVIPLVEEAAHIEKCAVETGRVRVSTHTETAEHVLREILRGDAVGVTRVPVNRTLAEGEAEPVIRTEGSVTIIPVLEEVLVVEKRLVLREEVHVRQTTSSENVEVPVAVRRQRAVIERVSPEGHVTEQQSETEMQEREP